SQPFLLNGTVTAVPQGSFPDKAFPLLSITTLKQAYVEHAPKRNYVMQWNLNMQRQLAPNLTATVGYVGSRGVHQPFRVDDANVVIPTRTTDGYLFPLQGRGTKINPAFGQITSTFYEGNSYYEALQVGLQKKMSRGFQV